MREDKVLKRSTCLSREVEELQDAWCETSFDDVSTPPTFLIKNYSRNSLLSSHVKEYKLYMKIIEILINIFMGVSSIIAVRRLPTLHLHIGFIDSFHTHELSNLSALEVPRLSCCCCCCCFFVWVS